MLRGKYLKWSIATISKGWLTNGGSNSGCRSIQRSVEDFSPQAIQAPYKMAEITQGKDMDGSSMKANEGNGASPLYQESAMEEGMDK